MRISPFVAAVFCFCSLSVSPAILASPLTLDGIVQSGAVGIANSRVYLMAASASSYGDASTSLSIGTANHDAFGNYALSHSDGSFSLPNITCNSNQQIYLLALGGNIAVSGASNDSIALISALGECSSTDTYPRSSIVVNEISTVASVYALSGFLRDATHVASSTTANAIAGLKNAFQTRNNLADYGGKSRSITPDDGKTAGDGSLTQNPSRQLASSDAQDKIDELANILHTCVSTDGTGSPCASLFQAVDDGLDLGQRDAVSLRQGNTVSVLRKIINHPSRNFNALYALNAKTGPFQPTHIVAPVEGVYPYPDWTLTISYTPANFLNPAGITTRFLAVDVGGNIWVTTSGNSVTELSPIGNQKTVVGENGVSHDGLNGPWGIAINKKGNIWVGNLNTPALTAFDSTGQFLTNEPPSGFPTSPNSGANGAIAIGLDGQIWVMSQGASLCNYTYTASANSLSPVCGNSPYRVKGAQPDDWNSDGLAISPLGEVWVADHDQSLLAEVDASNPATTIPPITTTAAFDGPMFLASNHAGEIWVSDQLNGSLLALDKNGTPLSRSPITSGGLCMPRALMFDGAGTLWVGNYTDAKPNCGNSISHFSGSGRPLAPNGLGNQSFTEPLGLAIDPSGNVWVASGQSDFVSEVVGAAVPVATPISPDHLGERP